MWQFAKQLFQSCVQVASIDENVVINVPEPTNPVNSGSMRGVGLKNLDECVTGATDLD